MVRCSIMVSSQGGGNVLADGGRVTIEHITLIDEKPGGLPARSVRQGKNLKETAVEGDQVLGDQAVAGKDVFVDRDPQQSADPVVTIERQAPAVGNKYQKKIEQEFVLGQLRPETIAEKAVLNESEAAAGFDSRAR